ncbi:DUF418 domain-containing protein [Deinococcus sp. Arct2-2]|uniref:DUF418 domain-containing protein n=1 Tax=Deinococcus sp. Arct2-2 TaxID=2568653 RepID=UPI0010A3105C|nr:DUF418 domain-containing protein [Deinococcus sp. Arct2-2]THF71197.1 DUF418 domain-containing protein [Deinococcus sp. Arct2-2]
MTALPPQPDTHLDAPPEIPPDSLPLNTEAPPERGPVRQRSPLPDVLRGLALLGILIVNVQDFAGFRVWTQGGLDRAVQIVTDIFANGRSISLFAMLFGWGAAGLLARQGVGTFLRRHAVLLALGTLHFIFIWHGDIIANYALLAAALLLTARLTAPTLVLVAGGMGGWWLADGVVAGVQASLSSTRFGRYAGLQQFTPDMPYPEVLNERAGDFSVNLIGGSIFNGPWLLALFCLGAAAYRIGLLLRPHEHLPLLRRLSVWGWGLGLPLGVLLAWLNTRGDYASGLLATPVRMGGGLALALGYVGVLGTLAAQNKLGGWLAFAASGRVAMSNYIAQSLIMTTVFYPYAGAQYGQWGAASAVALALLVGLAQLPTSAWVLRRWGMGPLERLVRALVYGWQK